MTTGFIYLASASPRRQELLTQIGVSFRTLTSGIAETQRSGESPAEYVVRVAAEKADDVWERVEQSEPAPVLAADTCVVVDETICGKPRDEAEALAMLALLSGRSHKVLTAVALRWQATRESALTESEVRFRTTTPAERLAYCRSGEPWDKAGAYAIQGLGAVFVDHLQGSYSAVMGLPLGDTARLLRPYGQPAWLTANVEQK